MSNNHDGKSQLGHDFVDSIIQIANVISRHNETISWQD